MKYTICVTNECNLRCAYCYMGKSPEVMPIDIAGKVIEFAYRNTPDSEDVNFGFFGGEPFLQFDLLQKLARLIEERKGERKVFIDITSNGTIFSPEIADFVKRYDIGLCISCDGPPAIHDRFRKFANGKGSSSIVERNILLAQASLPAILVNAVVRPETVENLPEVIRYFSNLGLKQIYLNPDYSASWGPDDVNKIQAIYDEVGKLYMDFYLQGTPHFISLIDSKITVILREGYRPLERCRMGTGEFAFSPAGNVYPCERLIGDDCGNGHCIGNISAPETIKRNPCHLKEGPKANDECLSCSLSEYCMNWCGCSNFFATGFYNRVSPFICASERAAILTSFRVMQLLEEKMGPVFFEHLAGRPQSKSRLN